MNDSEKKYYDERLQCFAEVLDYDFKTRTGILYIGSHGCCDMTGCVKLFKAVDPRAETINTFSSESPDTIYKKQGAGWQAFDPSGTAVGKVCFFEDQDQAHKA